MRTTLALFAALVIGATAGRVGARGDIGDTIGACCIAGPAGHFACEEISEADCAQFGAVFVGAGTTCASSACVTGACCVSGPAWTCLETLPIDCAAAGGAFVGPGVPCATGACTCAGDVNGDAAVDVHDIVAVVVDWDCAPGPIPCVADANGDGFVDVSDLVTVILAWGPCPR